MNDQELYRLCKEYGKKALQWRQKFIGLLPEVNRRRLYEKKGYGSIFEFAAKLAGVSQEQVRLALNLERRLEDKPALHSLLVEGEVSVNKLARVVSIATVENEEELAGHVRILSKQALDVLVRDENGLNKPKEEVKSLPGQTVQLSPEVMEELSRLQEQGQDVNEILLKLLKQRRADLEEKKEELSQEVVPSSRYIPAKIRQFLKEEYGEKCSIKTCMRPARVIHHTQRYSLTKTHDPAYLAPLCHAHHEIAHAIDGKAWEKRKSELYFAKCRC